MAKNQKALVFISHITEEKEIALALKQLVETTFLNMIDVFVSSDATDIKAGSRWLDEITNALKKCKVEIILASPMSVKRPWINWEGGAGWIRDIKVIPLCHSGMVPTSLPLPLNTLQAATATEQNELEIIFPVLAEAVGSSVPKADFSEFIQAVKNFEAESKQIKEQAEKSPIAPTDGLLPHEQEALVRIADEVGSFEDGTSAAYIRRKLVESGLRKFAVNLAMAALRRKDLIETYSLQDPQDGEMYTVVRITAKGWDWLEANKDMLNLHDEPPE